MNENVKHLIVISGPTAVGKSELTIELALRFGSEIISCDSRQFYKEMSIGTAKPTTDDLLKVKHHFIDSLSIKEDFSSGDFEKQGLLLLEDLFVKHNILFLTGGSGLYIKALCEGFDDYPQVDSKVFDKLNFEIKEYGISKLQERLKILDFDYYSSCDIDNPQRIIRALSIIETSGKKFSSFHKKIKKARPFQTTYIILNRDRNETYARINERVEKMFEEGLLLEVKSLIENKYSNALQTVGYQELFSYFDGEVSLEEAKELIKRNSRRYAKRQLTWFRKMQEAKWFHPDQKEDIIDLIHNIIHK